jgi:hypothetical protein
MPFALFSLSPLEILILGGLCSVPVIVGIVLLVTLRPGGSAPHRVSDREADFVEENQRLQIAALEAENQRLRDELERLKRGQSPETFTP